MECDSYIKYMGYCLKVDFYGNAPVHVKDLGLQKNNKKNMSYIIYRSAHEILGTYL